MGRGRKRKAEADEPKPQPSSSRVLRSGKNIEIEIDFKRDQSNPETRQQSKPKPILKALRRSGRGRDQNPDSKNESSSSSSSSENPAESADIFDGLEPETNPLLIPVIVKHLFEVWAPDFQTLKSTRLVCKTWFRETLPLWRSTGVLTILPDDKAKRARRGMGISDFDKRFHPDMNMNMDILQLARIPFSRFCLTSWEIRNNQCGASPQFWNILRPLVKYMRLKKCEFKIVSRTVRSHQSLLTLIFKNLPELQNLTVDRCQFLGGKMNTNEGEEYGFRTRDFPRYQCGRLSCPKSVSMDLANRAIPENHRNLRTLEVIGELPFFWKPFLRLFPNLETIRSRADDSGDYNCLTTAIQTLRQENPESLNIQHLDLMSTLAFRLDGPGLESLSGCDLNLQSLCIEIGNWEPPTLRRISREWICELGAIGLIHNMLAPQKETLRVLKLFRISSCDHGPFKRFSFGDNFTLNNLNEFHLYGPITDSFEFLPNVPNLRKLVINQKCEENWKNLREFRISSTNKFQGDMVKNTPATLFKNLANSAPLDRLIFLHVDMGFPVKSLETLAKATPNLTTLQTILNNASLITVGKKWTNLQELKLVPGSHVTDDGIIKFAPNSQNLRKFVLQTYCDDESLGDRSVEGGFLKMEGLHTLQICVSRKMTRNGEDELKKNIQEVVVHRNYGSCPHRTYCREAKLSPRCFCYYNVNHAEDSDFE